MSNSVFVWILVLGYLSVECSEHNAPAFHVRNSPSHNALLVEILQPEGSPSDCEWIVQLNITQLNGWSKTHLLSAPGVHLLTYSTSEMSQQLSACFTTSGIDCASEKSHITRKPDEAYTKIYPTQFDTSSSDRTIKLHWELPRSAT
ncbi:hypothetical protein EG68_11977, partial [Paragonimus skrjabini miyazakii]